MNREAHSRGRTAPLRFDEGALIPWSPVLMARMIIRGVMIGEHQIARRVVFIRCRWVARAWWRWTTALPGDRFYHCQRDLIIEVRSGTPRRREAAYITRRALEYRTVQQLGVDAALAFCPSEPCAEQWWEVEPA